MTAEQAWGSGRSSDTLVIPLRVRGLACFFPAIVVGLIVSAIVVIAVSRSLEGIIWSALVIATFSWIGLTMLAARRARGAMPRQIVATTEGLRSSLWEIRWDQVERIFIGRLPQSRQKTLVVEPRRSDDVRTPSKMLNLNLALSRALKAPQIQILQMNVDLPLDQIAVEFERLAGRTLLARDNAPG